MPEPGVVPDAPDSARSSRFIKGTAVAKPPNLDGTGVCALLWHPLNLLLACLPLGVVAVIQSWDALYVFWLLFFALIPLAKILGDATEELAAGLKNQMLAGLLNATFGNAVEMVICVQTLRVGLFNVVKATLLGSVLSNMLLVLGCSFFFGGIVNTRQIKAPAPRITLARTGSRKSTGGSLQAAVPVAEPSTVTEWVGEKVQHFPILSALVNTSMLLLSCLSYSLVTVFQEMTHVEGVSYLEATLLPVSRICSIIIMLAYGAYIIFQLVTHKDAMTEDEGDEDEDEEAPILTVRQAMCTLFATTLVVAVASELLVHTIDEVTTKAHISEHFIGIILLPIIGNACEHVSAVRFAMKDKAGLSIGIAVGSSTQIALFVVPFAVLAGWVMDKDMDLDFGALNTTVMTLSVVTVLTVVVDGQSNWLQGYLLFSAYLVISVLYWYLPNGDQQLS